MHRAHRPAANRRLASPPAMLRATPPELSALVAMLLACENLSQREKATVFVIVRTSAITGAAVASVRPCEGENSREKKSSSEC